MSASLVLVRPVPVVFSLQKDSHWRGMALGYIPPAWLMTDLEVWLRVLSPCAKRSSAMQQTRETGGTDWAPTRFQCPNPPTSTDIYGYFLAMPWLGRLDEHGSTKPRTRLT